MAGEIQLNSTTMATESSGTITLSNVDSASNRTNLGLGSMATQNANAVAITGGTINTVQPATGQSLTIKDEDGNTAITVGTDNTAAGYLSLNFGSYHGDSGGAGSGSLTANTLDDYEHGTFVPVYKATTTDPTVSSYGFNYGFYIKIGKVVHFNLSIRGNISSVGSGNVLLGGLPFTVDSTTGSTTGFAVGYYENWTTNGPTIAQGTADSTDISLYRDNGASGIRITDSNFKTGSSSYNEVYVAGTYITN